MMESLLPFQLTLSRDNNGIDTSNHSLGNFSIGNSNHDSQYTVSPKPDASSRRDAYARAKSFRNPRDEMSKSDADRRDLMTRTKSFRTTLPIIPIQVDLPVPVPFLHQQARKAPRRGSASFCKWNDNNLINLRGGAEIEEYRSMSLRYIETEEDSNNNDTW